MLTLGVKYKLSLKGVSQDLGFLSLFLSLSRGQKPLLEILSWATWTLGLIRSCSS